MTEIYVGTSGWSYSWNPNGFKWYAKNSGLNAVELNSSFYRFPFPSMIKGWLKYSDKIRWAIKVHRSITHYRKLTGKAEETWRKFERLFQPLDNQIDFYLFQMPPNYTATEDNIQNLSKFHEYTELGSRFAFEPRHITWFTNEVQEILRELGITVVSVDSPFITYIWKTNDIVYLRMHGRTSWYSHYYTDEELLQITNKIMELAPNRVYVFFNNDHDMLENGRRMLKILKKAFSSTD